MNAETSSLRAVNMHLQMGIAKGRFLAVDRVGVLAVPICCAQVHDASPGTRDIVATGGQSVPLFRAPIL